MTLISLIQALPQLSPIATADICDRLSLFLIRKNLKMLGEIYDEDIPLIK